MLCGNAAERGQQDRAGAGMDDRPVALHHPVRRTGTHCDAARARIEHDRAVVSDDVVVDRDRVAGVDRQAATRGAAAPVDRLAHVDRVGSRQLRIRT